MVKALVADSDEQRSLQTLHVGILSLANCLGRLAGGTLSGLVANELKRQRIISLLFPTTPCVLFHLQCLQFDSSGNFQSLCALTGLFYGATCGIFLRVVSDNYSLKRFSCNRGILMLGRALVAYILMAGTDSIHGMDIPGTGLLSYQEAFLPPKTLSFCICCTLISSVFLSICRNYEDKSEF